MTPHAISRLSLPVNERDHIRGSATALVSLVEYGDYECPACGAAFPVVEELQRVLGDRLRFVFRHFPLTQIHPHAQGAAEAAEAAGAQEMFWEMHATLFTHQHALDGAHLIRYASSIGLDPASFVYALNGRAYEKRVREDFLSGVRSGVNGTPTFFIDGVRYDGPADFDLLLLALSEAARARSPESMMPRLNR
jgi:protein-disulfide isomerase